MSDFPSQSQDKFVVRLPDGMRDRIKAAADKNGRSMNAEIVDALVRMFPPPLKAGDIIDDWARSLAFIEPGLREQAVDLLSSEENREKVKLWAEAISNSEKYDSRFPWEE